MGKYCQNCGKKLNDNAKFCNACGTPVNNENIQQESDLTPVYLDTKSGDSYAGTDGKYTYYKHSNVFFKIVSVLVTIIVVILVALFIYNKYNEKQEKEHSQDIVKVETDDFSIYMQKGLEKYESPSNDIKYFYRDNNNNMIFSVAIYDADNDMSAEDYCEKIKNSIEKDDIFSDYTLITSETSDAEYKYCYDYDSEKYKCYARLKVSDGKVCIFTYTFLVSGNIDESRLSDSFDTIKIKS